MFFLLLSQKQSVRHRLRRKLRQWGVHFFAPCCVNNPRNEFLMKYVGSLQRGDLEFKSVPAPGAQWCHGLMSCKSADVGWFKVEAYGLCHFKWKQCKIRIAWWMEKKAEMYVCVFLVKDLLHTYMNLTYLWSRRGVDNFEGSLGRHKPFPRVKSTRSKWIAGPNHSGIL